MSDQSLLNKLEQISYKYDEIAKQMVDPDIISDMKRYVSLNREYKELSEIAIDKIEKKNVEHLVLDGTFLRQKDLNEFDWVKEKKNYDLLFIYMNISIYYAYYNNIY